MASAKGVRLSVVNEREFEAFVVAHRNRALGMAWRLLGRDSAAAEDVTQEAFVRAFRGAERFRGDAKLSTWFFRILVNEVQRYRRRRWVRDAMSVSLDPELPEHAEAAPSTDDGGDPMLRRRIAAALDGLSRGQREAFVLVHLEGFTVTEAAKITGRAPGTLKSHLHRALRGLRHQLDDLNRGSEPGDTSHE